MYLVSSNSGNISNNYLILLLHRGKGEHLSSVLAFGAGLVLGTIT